jgi:hypothetical protein
MSSITTHENASIAIIESIVCPISGMPMKEPVTGSDGHTYERSQIVKWLVEKKAISPMTKEPMTVENLKVNPNIRYLCDKYHAGDFGVIERQKSKVLEFSEFKLMSKLQINETDENTHMFTFGVEKEGQFTLDNIPGVDLVIVEDRSGSTGSETSTQDSNGKKLEVGFSINDITNHAAKTVSASLRPHDRLGIIAFDNEIEEVQKLQEMTPLNKSGIMGKIDSIKPRGSTNIYGGVLAALEMLDARDDKTRQSAIIALTDGQPNISPARGETETLKALRESTNFSTPIYMMGFGYNLKKGLLYNMSREGNGATGHIPDGGMVGTAFSNFLANIMSSACSNLKLQITTFEKDFDVKSHCEIMGDFPYETKDNTLSINLGSVQYEQTRDIMIKGLPQYYKYTFSYKIGGKDYESKESIVNSKDTEYYVEESNESYSYNKLRLHTCETLRKCIDAKNMRKDTVALYNDLVAKIDTCKDSKSLALSRTIRDQVYMVLGSIDEEHRGYFSKWGEYYLDQLTSALLKQFTPNFKDEACKVFSNDCFDMLVNHIASTFDTLPPPIPSIKKFDSSTNSYRSGPGVGSMSTFNRADNGCWTGDSQVLMSNGLYKDARLVLPGDSIVTLKDHNDPDSKTITVVKTVVVTTQDNSSVKLVIVPGGCKLTSWHPFMHANGEWSFPVEKYKSNLGTYTCKKLYNLVLEEHHVVIISGTPCITLGHGFKDGNLYHPYFGTQKIIDDLKTRPDYNTGIVNVNSAQFIRNGDELYGGVSTVSGMRFENTFEELSFS